jgi:UPF0176 protein
MNKSDYQILLYYKYVGLKDPLEVTIKQREFCNEYNLKGRIIVANEGINGTIEGTKVSTEKYIEFMNSFPEFQEIHFKKSIGTGNAFPKLKVKVRPEIVSLHLGEEDINPREITGQYLEPEELHQWFQDDKEFYIVDMRNDYEFEVGQFEGSLLPSLKNFRDLPNVLEELKHLKGKTILTVCTGGVRCEKASGYLVNKGFKDVYQLKGGIVSYMEKYPNQNFLGKLYVFDGRVVMGFNTDSAEHKVISKCSKCGNKSDNYIDCKYLHCKGHRHFLCCLDCQSDSINMYCSKNCYELDLKSS